MKYLSLLFLLFISGCCPKLTSQITTSSDTTRTATSDTSTVLNIKIDSLPPVIIHDTVNFDTFCDSLLRGLKPIITIEKPSGTIKVKTDSLGKGTIECKTDSLVRVTVEQQMTINNLQEELIRTTTNKQTVKTQRWYESTWFYIAVIFFLLNLLQWRFKR